MTTRVHTATSQGRTPKAPAANEDGIRLAMEQIEAGWLRDHPMSAYYDRKLDTLFLRAKDAVDRPAVAYFLPGKPEIQLELDNETGHLVGIDLTEFRRALVKQSSELRHVYRWWQMAQIRAKLHLPPPSRPTSAIARDAASRLLGGPCLTA